MMKKVIKDIRDTKVGGDTQGTKYIEFLSLDILDILGIPCPPISLIPLMP